MPRLMPGENAKIDRINCLVDMVLSGDVDKKREGLEALLALFRPMILKLCKKWSEYFDDHKHTMIPWDVLVADAQYWFMHYTTNKYTVGGMATYNKFIKDHLSQRIRFIYETELQYAKHNIFPDPDKCTVEDGDDGSDSFDEVIYRYAKSSTDIPSTDEKLIADEQDDGRKQLVGAILSIVGDRRYFGERDELIFTECIVKSRTHDDVADELGISRARVSQIIGRIRKRLFEIVDDNIRGWEEYR